MQPAVPLSVRLHLQRHALPATTPLLLLDVFYLQPHITCHSPDLLLLPTCSDPLPLSATYPPTSTSPLPSYDTCALVPNVRQTLPQPSPQPSAALLPLTITYFLHAPHYTIAPLPKPMPYIENRGAVRADHKCKCTGQCLPLREVRQDTAVHRAASR